MNLLAFRHPKLSLFNIDKNTIPLNLVHNTNNNFPNPVRIILVNVISFHIPESLGKKLFCRNDQSSAKHSWINDFYKHITYFQVCSIRFFFNGIFHGDLYLIIVNFFHNSFFCINLDFSFIKIHNTTAVGRITIFFFDHI